jgi:hypothetical protein
MLGRFGAGKDDFTNRGVAEVLGFDGGARRNLDKFCRQDKFARIADLEGHLKYSSFGLTGLESV